MDNTYCVELTEPKWQAYDEFRDTVARLVAVARRRPVSPKESQILLMSLMKMRIICDAVALHDKEIPAREREKTAPKLRELEHVLSEEVSGNGRKAIVFSQWAGMLALTAPV